MKTKQSTRLGLILACALGTTAAFAEGDRHLSLSEVPDAVLAAAKEAVPGIQLSEAEVEETDKGRVYEMEGAANGKEYEISISEEGKVLGVELDDED